MLRGLVMVIMALDHVRDFYSPTPFRPEDLTQTTAAWFFTRWITHFCAPTFVFLSGASAFLYGQKRTTRQLSRFLLTRGLWLVFLEITFMSFILQWGYQLMLLNILWAIGTSMIVLAGLVWLPRVAIGAIALVIIALHNLIPNIATVTGTNVVWAILHNGPFVVMLGKLPVLFAYTILPWAAVMAAGYAAGPWFLRSSGSIFLKAGLVLLGLFVLIRASNFYGDPSPWAAQDKGMLFTILSFLNVTKYPPSLLFLCLTLGVGLVVLSVFHRSSGKGIPFLEVYGKVPFFYFLLHFTLISLSALVWVRFSFGTVLNLSFTDPKSWPPAYEPSLWRAYLVWIAVVLVLYFPCRWFGNYRKAHSYWWLSYV